MNQNVSLFTIDNQDYIVLEKTSLNHKTYLFLVNQNNSEDRLIEEYISPDTLLEVDESTCRLLEMKFHKKYEHLVK